MRMTVEELIERLREFDSDTIVEIHGYDESSQSRGSFEDIEVEFETYHGEDPRVVLSY